MRPPWVREGPGGEIVRLVLTGAIVNTGLERDLGGRDGTRHEMLHFVTNLQYYFMFEVQRGVCAVGSISFARGRGV